MTIKIHLDFETYSEAGFMFDGEKWKPLPGLGKTGLPAVGTAVYSEHPTTEILSMAYKINDEPVQLWTPDMPFPEEIQSIIDTEYYEMHAWNSIFEFLIWNNVGVVKNSFPPVPPHKFKCTMAKARAYSLPGSLKEAARVLNLPEQKKEGKLLLRRFSVPRNPTKNNVSTRNLLSEDEAAKEFYEYNMQDVATEHALDQVIPDLSEEEHAYWQLDQVINLRGVAIDMKTVSAFILILEQTLEGYSHRLQEITDGAVTSYTKLKKIIAFINERFNLSVSSLDEDSVNHLLADPPPPPLLEEILNIRKYSSMSSVKKLYALKYRTSQHKRLKCAYIYYGARTGRTKGAGVQLQNLPNSSIDRKTESVIEEAHLLSYKDFKALNPNPLENMSACIRNLFIAPTGKELIVSDYSSIEAVVLAMLAREEWRIKVFKSHGRIYEESVARITKTPLKEILDYHAKHKKHHPLRRFGKVAELAAGYQGGVSAWQRAGALEFVEESQLLSLVRTWRAENKNIVNFWYSIERCAKDSIQNEGKRFKHNDITFYSQGGILFCELPSKRLLVYHHAQLDNEGKISFWTRNTNPKHGKTGLIRMSTYGGKLVQNIVQAVARDILMHAICTLEKSGFPVVLHTHDEIVCEIPEMTEERREGVLRTFERLMSEMPWWAKHYPVKAAGGFIEKRYRK